MKSGGFTNSSMLITEKITKKIHKNIVTCFEGVKISQKFIFNAQNEVSPIIIKSDRYTNSNVLITEKIAKQKHEYFLTLYEGVKARK